MNAGARAAGAKLHPLVADEHDLDGIELRSIKYNARASLRLTKERGNPYICGRAFRLFGP